MKWPIFREKELVIGNKSSKIGVCTLWSPIEDVIEKHLGGLMDKIAVVGNLYSVKGLRFLIRNYLANPNLNLLIVVGTDLGKAKNAIVERLGKDESLDKKLFLEKEHIERFLKQVKILFISKQDIRSVIDSNLKDICPDSHEFEPLIIPIPKPKVEIFPSSRSGHLIRVRTIAEGYQKLLAEIRLFGHITGQDSEGHRRQELWRFHMVITDQDPYSFDSIPHPEYDSSYIRKYCEDFWQGTDPKDLAYRYGHIIRHSFGDQVEAVIEAFKKKEETFRTIISLWDPNVKNGSIIAKDPPCIIEIHPRIIGDCLELGAYIRTNDMYDAWTLNAIALRYFQAQLLECLKKKLIKRPNLKLGELEITSGSAHIYEDDWSDIDGFLDEVKPLKFFADPKGNFEIMVDNGEIIINHYSPDGDGDLLQVFHGKSALELSKKVQMFVSQIQNALYIGRELMKAETLLK